MFKFFVVVDEKSLLSKDSLSYAQIKVFVKIEIFLTAQDLSIRSKI